MSKICLLVFTSSLLQVIFHLHLICRSCPMVIILLNISYYVTFVYGWNKLYLYLKLFYYQCSEIFLVWRFLLREKSCCQIRFSSQPFSTNKIKYPTRKGLYFESLSPDLINVFVYNPDTYIAFCLHLQSFTVYTSICKDGNIK